MEIQTITATWDTVRDLANRIAAKHWPLQAKMVTAVANIMPGNPVWQLCEFTAEPYCTGRMVRLPGHLGFLYYFMESQVRRLAWESSSGSILEAVKENGMWTLSFMPSPSNPDRQTSLYEQFLMCVQEIS
jgi:hypothetical protein